MSYIEVHRHIGCVRYGILYILLGHKTVGTV